MPRSLSIIAVLLWLASVPLPPAIGQMAGSRGGAERSAADVADLPVLQPPIAEGYITIEGRAEERVRPTDVRVVLAVTSEGETAPKCQQTIDATIERLRAAWSKMGIGPERVVVDFIAVLPRYEWSPEKHGTLDAEVEKKAGFRMQTNVHLAARGEAEARAALAKALEQGITDIIAFDYWSKDLDGVKVKVQGEAVQAARSKGDALLGALFTNRPPVINVQEQTTVRYPESLYHSFTNSYEETVTGDMRRNVPYIHAYRPRNTYYRGLYSDGDVQPRELPMTPEISVISTVRLYFQSPAAKSKKKVDPARKGRPAWGD
ncbi:MAG: SIMPL domain-containing protein [Thermoguttaceae bacterium]